MLDDSFVKLVIWYDNEWGCANQCIEMVQYAARRDFRKQNAKLLHRMGGEVHVFKGLHGIDNSIGGVTVNDRLEVIDENFDPIPGLYAAGIVTSGWLGQGYGHAGTEMGLTMFSGYSAGQAAAEHAMGC